MTPPNSSRTRLRPWASNDRYQLLNQPGSSFVTEPGPGIPFQMIDPRMTVDPEIPASLKGILLTLLNYPTTWEHKHIVKEIMRAEWVKIKAARKYLNALIDAGYIHPVQYLDCDQRLVLRYKITALPIKPGPDDDPNPRTPVRLYGLQTARAQRVGFTEHSKTTGYRCVRSETNYGEMLREVCAEIAAQTEANRITGLAAWKELQLTSLNSNSAAQKPSGQKGTTITECNGSKINLTQKTIPTLPGEGFSFFYEEELPSTAGAADSADLAEEAFAAEAAVAPVTCGPAAPAKRKTASPKTPAAPRAMSNPKNERIDYRGFRAWSEDRRTSPTGDDLETFLTNYVTTYPAAVKAIAEAGNTGTVKWAEVMLKNPLMGMVQELLGLPSWTYEDLRKWSRRLRKGTVSTDDVVLLWTSKRNDSLYVARALALWDQRGYRALVPATHYATGVAIWPPDLSWAQLIMRMRRDANTRLLDSLPLPHVPRRPVQSTGARRTSDCDEYPVEERFVSWLTNDCHPHFFRHPDAAPYFLGLVEKEPLLWAMALPILQPGMPLEIQLHTDLLTSEVSDADIQEVADNAMAMHASLPGGLTKALMSSLYTDNTEMYLKSQLSGCTLFRFLPDGPEECEADAFFDTERQRERASLVA